MSFEDYLKKSDQQTRDLEKKILDLTNVIAQESYKNHQILAEQGESIDSLREHENQMNYNLQKSTRHLHKIGSYANGITKFFTKEYYYPPVKEEVNKNKSPIQMSPLYKNIDDPVNSDVVNNINYPSSEFELNLKKNLQIIKNIQLTILNELDGQINELSSHHDKISNLNMAITNLNNRIDGHLN
jgi:hypothetical protein